jgi:hypothetical protein
MSSIGSVQAWPEWFPPHQALSRNSAVERTGGLSRSSAHSSSDGIS